MVQVKWFNIYSQWKFHNFSITQILCEIDYGDSRSAKSVILTQLEALDFDVNEFWALFQGRKLTN